MCTIEWKEHALIFLLLQVVQPFLDFLCGRCVRIRIDFNLWHSNYLSVELAGVQLGLYRIVCSNPLLLNNLCCP